MRWVDDLGTLLAALTATVLCLGAASRHPERLRLFWRLLGTACAAWTLGEAVWAVYDLVLMKPVPVPSWADIGYLAAIPLAAGALLAHPSMRGSGARTARSMFDGLVVATALLFVSWVFVLGPIERSTDLTTLGGIVALAYPFGDIVIVWLVVILIRRLTGRDRLSLVCLLAGLVAMALADSTYAYLTQVKSYTTGELFDTGWVVGYLGIALAAFYSRPSRVVRHEQADAPTLAPLIAGFVPMLAALGVVSTQVQLGRPPDSGTLVIAFVLTLLVLARQALVMVDLAAAQRSAGLAPMTRLHVALLGRSRGSAP